MHLNPTVFYNVLGCVFIMSKDFRDFKFKFWFKVSKGHFPINKIVKFRSANGIDLFIIGLKLSCGMPYLHRYIYEQGYDAGFRRD